MPESQQRTYEVNILAAEQAAHSLDSPQAGHPCPAQNTVQHGLCLIVGRVAGEHKMSPMTIGDVLQEPVARVSGRGFYPVPFFFGQGGHVGLTQLERQGQPMCQIGHKTSVICRPGPQAMVEMGND
jgi:hypothetical protein